MSYNTTAKSTVLIDNKQAEEALKKLQTEAKDLRQEMERLKKANDLAGFEKVKKEVDANARAQRELKRELFSVDKVMKNLSGATMNQLKTAQRAITAELGKMTRGTTDYINKSRQLRQVEAEIRRVKTEMHGAANAQQGWMSKANGFFSKWGGWVIAGAAALTGISLGFKKLAEDANEFESRLANLSALTGLDGSSLDWLGEKAKSLSIGVTEDGVRITKSANDIVDAFTLMGSAKPELLKNKEALALVTTEALKLAEAAKMDTKTAVESLANVMNQFSAGADQANKFINVLAAGSKEGAAAVDSIADSIIKFGPAAAAANISVEESVGLIEALAEKGLKGEKAGTGLKTALLKLQSGADEFNPKLVGLSKALENLEKANLSAAQMTEMFGLEAYIAGSIMINNRKQVDYYTKAVTGTNVATEQAIKNTQTMAAQLEQARNKLKLASIDLGQRLGGALIFSTNMVRKFINVIIEVDRAFKRWRAGVPSNFSDAALKIKEEQTQVNRLMMQLTDANTKEGERKKIIDELNKISPKLVQNINAEKLELEQLKNNLKEYNQEATNRIILANLEADEQKALTQLADARQKTASAQVRLQEVFLAANEDIALSQGTFNEKLAATTKYLLEQVKIQEKENRLGDVRVARSGQIVDYRTKEQKLLQNILDYNTYLITSQEELAKVEGKTTDYQKRIEALKEILGLTQQITSGGGSAASGDPSDGLDKTLEGELKTLDAHYKQKKLLAMNSYNERKTSEEFMQIDLMSLELANLYTKLELHKKYGKESIDIEIEIADKVKQLNELKQKSTTDMLRAIVDEYAKAASDIENKYFKAAEESLDDYFKVLRDEMDKEDKIRQKALDRRNSEAEQHKAIADNLGASMGDLMGRMATDSEMTSQDVSRSLLMIMLDTVHSIVRMSIAKIWAESLAMPDSVATLGSSGIARALIISGLVEGVFAGLKAAISSSFSAKQRAAGKYDVIGADDGRTYRGVSYAGNMQTGIYSTPTLVGERGSELVVDAATLRNLQINFPHVLPSIRAAMVPQRAAGNVGSLQPMVAQPDPEMKRLVAQNNAIMSMLHSQIKKGIVANMSYKTMKKQTAKAESVESMVSRKG